MRGRLPIIGAVAALLASTGYLFAPLLPSLLGLGEPRFLEWDVPEQYWPDLVSLCGALHEGALPLWNPYDRGGYPSYADPQAGTYHPMNWAICALAGPSPSLGWAEARVVLGFFLAGLFGLLWLRRLGQPVGSALLGAVVIQAAPFMRHNWELNLTTALAFLPMMLWAAERAVTSRRLLDGALLGFSAGLCAWVGSPPALWFSGALAASYYGWRSIEELRAQGREALRPWLLTSAAAGVFAAGFSLVVLVPGALLARSTVQAGRSLADISAGALEPSQLVALISPQPGNHLYLGLIPLILAFLAFLPRGAVGDRVPSIKLPGRWFHLLMALIAVLMTLGVNGPLFEVAFDWVPGVAIFRLPHRYEAWLGPTVGALASAGLSRLSLLVAKGERPRRRRSELLLAAAVVLSALLLLDVSRRLPTDRHTRPGAGPASLDAAPVILERAPGTEGAYRYFDEFGISCRSGTRLGRRDLRGYQDPLMLKAYERIVAALRERPRLAEQLNVRFLLTGPHFIHGSSRHYLPPAGEILATIEGAVDRGEGVIELPEPLPAAYWVPLSQAAALPDRPSALRALLALELPAPVALLDREAMSALPRLGAVGDLTGRALVAARGFTLERDRLELRIDAPGPGVLVVNEAWYPGWRALLDGREVPIYRANALVRAVSVDEGEHRLEMTFRPTDGVALRWLLLLTWVAFAVVVALTLRRRSPSTDQS